MTKLATYYTSSKGEAKLISDMPFSYAQNALRKLERTEPDRIEEIEGIRAHLAELAKSYRAELEAERASGSASAERIAEIDAALAELDAR